MPPYCSGPTKRNGRTSSGAQRWRCTACGASTTVRYDDTAARFDEFLSWLLSKDTQLEMPGAGRTFRRRTAEFWEVWPMPVPDGEFHRVLFVDGIWLAERLVVLICCSEDRVVSWYMAQSENSRAWSALMEPIPAPDVVVTDGGSGFAKAVRAAWPRTKVQRCLFHAYAQVKRCTTTRPKLQAGRELYQIALDLTRIKTLHQAELWRERYLDWCGFWSDFLEDTTLVDGKRVYTHERLRKARRSLSSLVSAGTLFTFLDPELTKAGPLPYTNNKIEGGVNAQLRAVLRNHRGLTTLKRVKAVFWWCHAHSGDARTAKEKLATMPRDSDIDLLYDVYSASRKHDDGRPEWGDRAVWEELHRKDPFPFLCSITIRTCSGETHILSYKPLWIDSVFQPLSENGSIVADFCGAYWKPWQIRAVLFLSLRLAGIHRFRRRTLAFLLNRIQSHEEHRSQIPVVLGLARRSSHS